MTKTPLSAATRLGQLSGGARGTRLGLLAALSLAAGLQTGCAADEPAENGATQAQAPAAIAGTSASSTGAAGALAATSSSAAGRGAAQLGAAGSAGQGSPIARTGSANAVTALAAGSGGAAGSGMVATASAGASGAPSAGRMAMGSAGAGAAGMSAAAGAGGPSMPGADECGADAKEVMAAMPRASGNGDTNLQTSGDVEFLEARSTLTVPSKPTPDRGTLFLWPGLQPLKSDPAIGYGVLQPVLTWGSSCAPGTLSESDGWWISAQYVGTPPGSFSVICKGGDVMKVDVGDKLDIVFKLEGTMWKQTVTNQKNGKAVSFSIDMKGQKQQWLLHQIETPTQTKPIDDVIFSNVVAKLSASQPSSCYPNAKGSNDYFAPPRASADGKTCCISKIILRAAGVKASSPDTP